jgi:hypothetical protein
MFRLFIYLPIIREAYKFIHRIIKPHADSTEKIKIFSTHVPLPRLLVTPFFTELDTNQREHILEEPMSAFSSIKVKHHVLQKRG